MIDERVNIHDQVNFMIQRFQEITEKFHDLECDNKSLYLQNDSIKQAISKQENLLIECLKKLESNSYIIDKSISMLSERLDRCAGKIEDLEKLSVNLKKSLIEAENVNGALTTKVILLQDEHKNSKELINLVQSTQKAKDSLIDSLNTKLNSLLAKQEELDRVVNQRFASISAIDAKISDISNELKSLRGKTDEDNRILEKKLEKSISDKDLNTNQALDLVKKQVENIKIPSLNGVPSKDDLSNLSKQIETLSLDARNASLKAANCDMQIQLINKKIENISLNLKNIELTK